MTRDSWYYNAVMLEGKDIIYVANDWFRENKTSSHHIAEELAKQNRLLYVEAAGLRPPRKSGRDALKILRKLKRFLDRPVEKHPNIWVYSPVLLPFHRVGLFRSLNQLLLGYQLRRAERYLGFDRPILWLFLPHFYSVPDTIPHTGLVYYVTDEYSAAPGVDAEAVKQMEEVILRRADVVFTVSDFLFEKKSRINPNTVLSPHGVDFDLFHTAAEGSTPVPADIRDIPHPIAGFFGLIEEWIDIELIAQTADANPDVSFVLIGREAANVALLRTRRNVHLLGHKPYSELPAYLSAFDVCLQPYKNHPQVVNSNPKKLREYLAAGKPVVSTPVREVEKYGAFVYIAHDHAEFSDRLREAIRGDIPEKAAARIQAMRAESWEQRVKRISEIVDHTVRGKNQH
jgi:glycosyltransferase involved in cell wall biosynthesis